MQRGKILSLEDRVPKIKEYRRRKANRRLIFLLSLFFLLIVLVVYFQSPLSHVKQINIEGHQIMTTEELENASGIKIGENLWEINKKEITNKILEQQAIKDASVKLAFPNAININVKEYSSIALFVEEQHYYPLLENGNVLVKDQPLSLNAPIVIGFKQDNVLKELSKQLKQIPSDILNSISEIHYDPTKTDKYHIYLFMNDGYEVTATIPTLSEKIIHYPAIIGQLDPDVKGVIDFEVGSYFKAYETKGEDMNEKEDER